MPQFPFLLYVGAALLVGGVLFFLTSIAGIFWPKPTPMDDLGLYAFTLALVGLGALTLFLRYARLHPGEPE